MQQPSWFSISVKPIQGQLNGTEPIQMQLCVLAGDTRMMHELPNNII